MNSEEARFSKHQISVALLEIYATENKSLNRYNVVGRPSQKGNLEQKLGADFSTQERILAYGALRGLEEKGHIVPTYSDTTSPSDWLTITDIGQRARVTGALDELDEVLLKLDSAENLIEKRYGAHDAIASRGRDWQRHVAISCRELITGVLHAIAPDQEVKEDPKFVSDSSSKNGITRAERIRHYLRKKFGRVSKNDFKIIENIYELLESLYIKLNVSTHTDNKQKMSTLLNLTENLLVYLLSDEYN